MTTSAGAVTTRTVSPGATSRSTEAANASSIPNALITVPSGHTIVSSATTPSPYGRRSTSAPSGETRSEEHTSELQSRLHLVCRLLLEKKKTKKYSTSI